MSRTKTLRVGAAAFALAALAGCSGYNNERGRGDAPIAERDDGAWQIINSPDGFGNIATRCNPFQPGTRVYVVTHGKTDVQPVIVDDPACGVGEG